LPVISLLTIQFIHTILKINKNFNLASVSKTLGKRRVQYKASKNGMKNKGQIDTVYRF